MSEPLLTVYFDGLCPLCSREIEHYRKKNTENKIQFTDIFESGFSAEQEGLDPKKVHQLFHVKTREGKIMVGVEAFVAIWKILPGFRWLAWVGEQPAFIPLLNAGYHLFAKIRPFLPRKKASPSDPNCEADVCRR